ncbi:MAG TPA: hypothetical protein VK726_25670 [Acetobacteraceae bacterium]|jgi:hypothetical protein|nr:hypothetical protein [Acetobacteraceae bacterium]
MTIAGLAAALRGMPRGARLLIDTPGGLNLRWVSPAHVRAAQDGSSVAASAAGEYAVVLHPEGRQP